MAAPNIVAVSSILGKSAGFSLADTNPTVVVNNAASSNKVLKVNSVVVANDDGTNTATVTLSYNSQDDGGGTAFKLAHQIDVPPKTALVLVDKNSALYLEEDRSLVATASAGGDLDVFVSYEEIDDA